MVRGIDFHLDVALGLLDAGSVFNVTFMEGKPVMMETTQKGKAVTISAQQYVLDNPEKFGDKEDVLAFSRESAALTREHMLSLAEMVLPREWETQIGKEPLHGTLELQNPMRCSFFLFTNMDKGRASRAALDATPADTQPFASGYKGVLGCAVRILPTEPMNLQELNLPQEAVTVADVKGGLVLVVGSPGVGKSTTAAAFVDHVNRTRSGSIVTAEQPIEVPIASKKSVVTQREVGVNVASVRMALRDAERNFAHSAFIGEIQTLDDELEAFNSARHGLFVVATSFANNAVDAVKTLATNIDKTGSNGADLVSGTLLAVVYQVRLPSKTEGRWEFAYECLPVHENDEVVRLIRAGEWTQLTSLVNTSSHLSLNGSLRTLVERDKVTREAAMVQAYDKKALAEMLGSPR